MSKIRGKDTEPEILLRKSIWALGVRYRLNVSKLPGKPDIVIEKKKVVVFIDGEFWHGYNWKKKKRTIKANRSYWIAKIERNMKRDVENNKKLQALGYTVFRFWGNDIKKHLPVCLATLKGVLCPTQK